MIVLDFSEFAVDMQDPAALHEALLGDFNGSYPLDETQSTTGELNFLAPTTENEARIRMIGTFDDPPGGPDNVVFSIEIYGDGPLGAVERLVVTGPVQEIIPYDAAFEDFIVGGDITALYVPGQNLEIRGSNGFGDYLIGGTLGDRLLGFGGNDSLSGGAGNDTMTGGAGNDVYFFNSAADRAIEAVGGGTDTVRSRATETLDAGVERLMLTGAAAINGSGNSSANTITGNLGSNTLNGKAGADVLRGGGGDDTLVWSAPDRFDGGAGDGDLVRVFGAGVSINLQSLPASKLVNVEIFDLTGSGNNSLTLNLDDVLSSGNDTLRVMGNAGDSFQRGNGWTQATNQTIDGQVYFRFTQGSATLLVDTDISQGT